MTSTLSPQMASLISVTSSGRSSIRRMIRCMSGLFLRIDFATSFSKVVLPAFGGDTIIPLCPLPIGLIRSTILMATVPPGLSIISLSFGKIGVISSKLYRLCPSLGWNPLIEVTYSRALNFSPCVLIRIFPLIISPVFRLNLRI